MYSTSPTSKRNTDHVVPRDTGNLKKKKNCGYATTNKKKKDTRLEFLRRTPYKTIAVFTINNMSNFFGRLNFTKVANKIYGRHC